MTLVEINETTRVNIKEIVCYYYVPEIKAGPTSSYYRPELVVVHFSTGREISFSGKEALNVFNKLDSCLVEKK